MSTQPVDMFAGGDTVPSVSFKDAPVGTSVTGVVTVAPSLVQSRDFDTGNPAFWPDNNPKMSVVTRIAIPSGEERSLWAAKPSAMYAAIADAQKATGALIAIGGTLTITLTGFKPAENTRLSPQKLYTVTYVPPNAFEQPQAATPASAWSQPATPPPVWSQPAAPAPLAVVPPVAAGPIQYTDVQIAAAKAAGIPLPGIN